MDGGTWRNSGTSVTGLTAGTHTVSFRNIYGWITPASKSVTISAGSTTAVTGTYIMPGSLRVTIYPWLAMMYGAMWRVDSSPWLYSDTTVTGLAPGLHTVTFSMLYGFIAPASQLVNISPGVTTTTSGTYYLQMWGGAGPIK